MAAGRYDDAIGMMTTRKFAIVEGANLNVADQWTNAHMLRGQQRLAGKQYQEALADFQAARAIPSNLPSARSLGFDPGGDRRAPEFTYWIGVAFDAMGDHRKGHGVLESRDTACPARKRPVILNSILFPAAVQSYYARAVPPETWPDRASQDRFFRTWWPPEKRLSSRNPLPLSPPGPARPPQSPRARLATAHYISGLGYLGLGDKGRAKQELTEALQFSPDLLGARSVLSAME